MTPAVKRLFGLLIAVTAVTTACSSNGTSGSAPSASPEASASGPIGQRYTTTSFKVPLTVIVEPLLKSPPNPDSPNLLSWDAALSPNEAVRFLIPVELYSPGSSAPRPPPRNYLDYLRGQAAHGGKFSHISTITVDGHPGTLMTATARDGLDGSLGCPVRGADQADGCFGLQPDLSLRIAVIDMGAGTTLLAWARTGKEAPDAEFVAMFERMLASVQFK
jgi:hypothetical protein